MIQIQTHLRAKRSSNLSEAVGRTPMHDTESQTHLRAKRSSNLSEAVGRTPMHETEGQTHLRAKRCSNGSEAVGRTYVWGKVYGVRPQAEPICKQSKQ